MDGVPQGPGLREWLQKLADLADRLCQAQQAELIHESDPGLIGDPDNPFAPCRLDDADPCRLAWQLRNLLTEENTAAMANQLATLQAMEPLAIVRDSIAFLQQQGLEMPASLLRQAAALAAQNPLATPLPALVVGLATRSGLSPSPLSRRSRAADPVRPRRLRRNLQRPRRTRRRRDNHISAAPASLLTPLLGQDNWAPAPHLASLQLGLTGNARPAAVAQPPSRRSRRASARARRRGGVPATHLHVSMAASLSLIPPNGPTLPHLNYASAMVAQRLQARASRPRRSRTPLKKPDAAAPLLTPEIAAPPINDTFQWFLQLLRPANSNAAGKDKENRETGQQGSPPQSPVQPPSSPVRPERER